MAMLYYKFHKTRSNFECQRCGSLVEEKSPYCIVSMINWNLSKFSKSWFSKYALEHKDSKFLRFSSEYGYSYIELELTNGNEVKVERRFNNYKICMDCYFSKYDLRGNIFDLINKGFIK